MRTIRFGGLAGLIAATMISGAAAAASWDVPAPYSRDRSVVVERSPVDPSPIERHYTGYLPACQDAWALARIQFNFGVKESRFWSSSLSIAGFTAVREVAYRPWGYGKIPRRYCQGEVLMSDGQRRRVDYSIIEKGGFAGFGTGVEWCVRGLDRGWGYAPNCQMARP